MEDCWQWSEDIKGKYIVKSAYKTLINSYNVNTSGLDPIYWKKIWALELPAKVRNFLWRACTGCLPIMEALRSKQVAGVTLCPVCEQYPEDTCHALIKCNFARCVWGLTTIGDINANTTSFNDWWKLILQKKKRGVQAKIAMIL